MQRVMQTPGCVRSLGTEFGSWKLVGAEANDPFPRGQPEAAVLSRTCGDYRLGRHALAFGDQRGVHIGEFMHAENAILCCPRLFAHSGNSWKADRHSNQLSAMIGQQLFR